MAGNGHFWLDHLHGFQRVIRPHCKIIANRRHKQIDADPTVQFHFQKQGCITGKIEVFTLGGNQQAGRVAAVTAVGQTGAVVGNGQLQMAKLVGKAPPICWG